MHAKDLNRPNYPYHEKMKKLLSRSRSYEDLKSLVARTEGLIDPESPMREEYLTTKRTKTNVTIVEHMPNTKPTFISVDKVEGLRIALSDEGTASQSPLGTAQPTMRLYIVEDLSTDVVELLGSRYNIDPLFFSTQYNFRGYRYRGLSEALRLQVSKKNRKWFHIDNVRIHWDISQSFSWGPEDDNTQNFNIVRDLDSHHTGRGQEYISILSTRTAFWLGKDGEGGPLVGIVLLDPTNPIFRGGYRDKSIPRPTTTSESEQAPDRKTWYSDIVETSSRFLGNQPFPPGTAINLMAVVYPATIAVCAEWLKVCHFYSITLDKVESVFVSPSESVPIRNEIDEALGHLSRLSKYLPNWRKMVVATLEDAMPSAMRLIQPASHPEKKQEDLLLDQIGPDLKRILRNIEELQTQVTRLTERGVAEMQLQAARESLAESHNLARLSWLATVFVPLTFLSGMFSMSQDISSLQVSFKYYFGIGIPLVIVALIVVRWGPDVTRGMVEWFWGAVCFSIRFCFRWSYLHSVVLGNPRSSMIYRRILGKGGKF